jgi:hypothetical protein
VSFGQCAHCIEPRSISRARHPLTGREIWLCDECRGRLWIDLATPPETEIHVGPPAPATMKCGGCGVYFESGTEQGRFCSRSCANAARARARYQSRRSSATP